MALAIYLDNSATTPLCESAKKKIAYMLDECWANPSSIHHLGVIAKDELDKARKIIAEKISAREDEIFFTSGGTESNNIAIFGAAEKLSRRGKKIITSSSEHPSVENAMKALENKGFEVIRLPVGENGSINIAGSWEEEFETSSYTLVGDVLTIVDPDGTTLELTRAE